MAKSRHLRGATPVLAVYALLLALALLSPTSSVQSRLVVDVAEVLQRLGVSPLMASFTRVEVLLNILIVAPLTFLGSMALPRLRWQDWTAYGFLGATVVELVQGLLLPDRQASFSDIVANGSGAFLGAILHLALQRVSARDRVPR